MNQEEQDQFQLMVSAIREIDGSMDPNFVFYRAKGFLRQFTFGAEHTTQTHGVFALTQLVTSLDPAVKRFRKITIPESFLEIRLSRDDFAHDPVITMAAKTSQVFTWQDANALAGKRGLRVADSCKEHTGQRDHGLVIPMVGMNMIRGCASIGLDSSPDAFSSGQIMMIRHVMERAYARLDALLGPFTPDDLGDKLSERELDVLRRIAEGMTAAQAAKDMGIAKDTAIDYLNRAKRKTGTTKTAHTVKVALATGLMLP
ncbi:MAG: LuxR C-terminal-related transcriptional regulator [Pseudomonadota bacterium]